MEVIQRLWLEADCCVQAICASNDGGTQSPMRLVTRLMFSETLNGVTTVWAALIVHNALH